MNSREKLLHYLERCETYNLEQAEKWEGAAQAVAAIRPSQALPFRETAGIYRQTASQFETALALLSTKN